MYLHGTFTDEMVHSGDTVGNLFHPAMVSAHTLMTINYI